jgi:single-strand DNA-binding protein
MAGNFNKVLLLGNLTRDPELRYTPSNMAVTTLGVAVNRRYKGQDGEMKEEVTFVDCDAWGRTAEVISQYLTKGRPIFIEGRLRLDQWQDKDGGNRSKLKVVVENFQFVDSRGGEGGGGGNAGGPRGQSQRAPQPAGQRAGEPAQQRGPEFEPIGEDDIPF